jgi:TRAP-type C4-dicarboxylate transport system substrate-binding protein
MVVPWEVMPSFKLHELTKAHTEISGNRGLYTTPFLFLMNKARYESLSAEHREIIDKNSGMVLAKMAGRLWDEIEMPARKLAVDAGGEFHELSGRELEEIKAVANQVTDAWIASADQSGLNGMELVKSAQTLIKKYEDRSQ